MAANAAVDYCFNVFCREGVFDSLFEDACTDTCLDKYATNMDSKFVVNNYGKIKNQKNFSIKNMTGDINL